MRTIKLVDCWIQGLMILAAVPIAFSNTNFDGIFFGVYFMVGGWQILSVILHRIFYTPQHKSFMRHIYLITLAIVAGVLLASITSFIIWALYGLLFFSPLMAVYYLITCVVETKKLPEVPEPQAIV